MAVLMSDTEFAALQRAYNTGAQEVRYADRTVKYRSRDEMAAMIAEQQSLRADRKPVRQVVMRPVSGFARRSGF